MRHCDRSSTFTRVSPILELFRAYFNLRTRAGDDTRAPAPNSVGERVDDWLRCWATRFRTLS